MEVMAAGTWQSPVPLLVGINTNEGDTFVTVGVRWGLPALLWPYVHRVHCLVSLLDQGGLKVRLPGPLADAAYDLIFGLENAKLVRAQVCVDGGDLTV